MNCERLRASVVPARLCLWQWCALPPSTWPWVALSVVYWVVLGAIGVTLLVALTLMTQPPDQDRATQQLGGRTPLSARHPRSSKTRRAEQTTMDPSRQHAAPGHIQPPRDSSRRREVSLGLCETFYYPHPPRAREYFGFSRQVVLTASLHPPS